MDNPLVSVIVPTYNSANHIEACLRSIKAQTYPNIELIVVDEHSQDATPEIARKYTDKFYVGGLERSAKRNYGAKKAKGKFLLFIDSDQELSPNIVEACVREVENSKCQAIIIPEVSIGEGFWARCKALERSCYAMDDSVVAARFFVYEAFEEISGYAEDLVGAEDWDIHQKIREKGWKISVISYIIRHHEGAITLLKSVKAKYYYSRVFIEYIKRHPTVASNQFAPIRPALLKNWHKWFKCPFLCFGVFLMKICEGSGVLFGMLQALLKMR